VRIRLAVGIAVADVEYGPTGGAVEVEAQQARAGAGNVELQVPVVAVESVAGHLQREIIVPGIVHEPHATVVARRTGEIRPSLGVGEDRAARIDPGRRDG